MLHVCSVLVSTHGFKNELCYMCTFVTECTVLRSTHGFKCYTCSVLALTHGTTRLPEIP